MRWKFFVASFRTAGFFAGAERRARLASDLIKLNIFKLFREYEASNFLISLKFDVSNYSNLFNKD